MAIQRWAGGKITCLAADTKPTTVPTNTELIETDTRKKFYFDGTTWILQEPPNFKRYDVFQVGSTTYITDTQGKIASSNTDTQLAIQPLLDEMTNQMVREFNWDSGLWTINNPILLPSITSTGSVRKVFFKGQGWLGQRQTNVNTTTFQPSTTFPTNRYLIECPNTGDATAKTSMLEINGFQFYNPNFATLPVGAILLEAGNLKNGGAWSVKNCYFHSMWNGVTLYGVIWFGEFENLVFTTSSSTFLGDSCIKMGSGGHTGAFGTIPKANSFRHLCTNSGDGVYDAFIKMTAASYNVFDHIFIDGKYYDIAAFTLNNSDATYPISSNTFNDVTILDDETTVNTIASVYMTGTEVEDTIFHNSKLQNVPISLRMDSAGVTRNVIELAARWSTTAVTSVNDTGSGNSNTIRVIPGVTTGTAVEPITHTGGVSRVIDCRRGAENSGFTSVADGGTISHGLMTTPLWIMVVPSVASEMVSVTAKSSTTFTVALKKHDNTVGTTQSVYWRAGVYA
jgi:hypothetical protein